MQYNNERLKDYTDVKSKSISLYYNPLFQYLSRRVGVDPMIEAFKMYGVDTVSIRGGSPAFWYKDINGKEIMVTVEAYQEATGKPNPLAAYRDYFINPDLDFMEKHYCYFGEHLLNQKPDAPVIVVENERSALFCGRGKMDYVWLSPGPDFHSLASDMHDVLVGRDVVFVTFDPGMVSAIKRINNDNDNINVKYLVMNEQTIPSMKQGRHEDMADLLIDSNTRYELMDVISAKNIRSLLDKETPDERRSHGFRR